MREDDVGAKWADWGADAGDAGDLVTAAYAGELLPDVQVHTFRTTERLFPTRRIGAGRPRALPLAPRRIADLPIAANGAE